MMRLVRMRRERDCGVACFATLFNLSYEDAAEAIIATNGPLGKGLYMTSLQRAAAHLKKTLRQTKKYDPAKAEGILWVEGKGWSHFVVLTEGRIYDPQEATLWSVAEYCAAHDVTLKTLLTRASATS